MTPIQRTLLAMAAFVALAVGSFVYFIANWDKAKAKPIGMIRTAPYQTAFLFSVPKNPGVWGSAPVLSSPTAGRFT